MDHFRPMLCIRRVVTQKRFFLKDKKEKELKIKICEDQNQINWIIPGILNDEMNFLQIEEKINPVGSL